MEIQAFPCPQSINSWQAVCDSQLWGVAWLFAYYLMKRQSKGGLEHGLGDISSRSQAVGAAVPEGWSIADFSLRVLRCSAGGTRAGFPDVWTCFPGPWDHPADGDSPGASPAECCSQNLLPEEHAGHNPQVHPESRVHTGKAPEEEQPKVVPWSLASRRCEKEEQLPTWAQMYVGAKDSWARSFQWLVWSFTFSSPKN